MLSLTERMFFVSPTDHRLPQTTASQGHRMRVHVECPASGIMDEDVMCTLQGRWLLQNKINVLLNPHLLTAAVQRLQDSKKKKTTNL